MRVRLQLTAVGVALAWCSAIGGAQLAGDGMGQYAVVREYNLPMKTRDGTVLVADVYRPVTKARVPALLERTPYARTVLSHYLEGHYWASHGFAYVVQDVRGRGDSQGTFEPLVDERRDGYDTQSWVASRPWSDGQVATLGGSYLGWTQLLTASLNNPAVRAMIPTVTPPDPGGFWPQRRGALSFGMLEWLIEVQGRTTRALPDGEPEYLGAYRTPPLDSVDIRMGARSDVWQRYLANLENPSFWVSRSYQPELTKSRFPMLHVTGWYDGTMGGSLQNFTAMRARASAETKAGQYLLIGPWRHWVGEDSRTTTVEGVNFGERSKVVLPRQYRAWFERWMMAKTDAIAAWPRVRLFAMGENRWLGGDDWPLPGTRFVPYYLSGAKAGDPSAGSMVPTPPADGADRYDYDPKDPTPFLWHRNVDSGGPDDYRSVEARSDVLVYTMPKPKQPMTVCGPVSATIVASTSARDVDVVARLSLVHADGTSQRLADGWVRARARNGEFRNDPLVPGKAETYHLDLWGTCVSLTSGQTLRLAVMSGAFPLVTPNLDTGGPLGTERTPIVAHQSVHHERGRLSSVTLPIVDAPRWIEIP